MEWNQRWDEEKAGCMVVGSMVFPFPIPSPPQLMLSLRMPNQNSAF